MCLHAAWFVVNFQKKTVLCLGEKQDMSVSNECSSSYTRVDNFCCHSAIEKESFI